MTYEVAGGAIYTPSSSSGGGSAAPHFVIVSVDAPSSVSPGSQFSITVTVKNDGNAAGSATVELVEPSGSKLSKDVSSLDPGSETSVSFSVTAPSNSGTYTYKVDVVNGSTNNVDDSKTINITVTSSSGEPKFVISNVDYPGSVTAGATVTIDVYVENTGSASGDAEVQVLDESGNVIVDKTVTVDPGKTVTVEADFTAPSTAGTYTYTVKVINKATGSVDDSKQLTITVTSSSSGSTGGSTSGTSGSSGGILSATVNIMGVEVPVVLLVVALLVLIFLLR